MLRATKEKQLLDLEKGKAYIAKKYKLPIGNLIGTCEGRLACSLVWLCDRLSERKYHLKIVHATEEVIEL